MQERSCGNYSVLFETLNGLMHECIVMALVGALKWLEAFRMCKIAQPSNQELLFFMSE
jgi:hypothetical protein